VLADDHTLLRKTLMNSLEQRDEFVVVAEAGDGESALQQTVTAQPDLIILDLNMPIKGGLEALPEIRAQAPRTKILILSGRQEEAYIVQALRAGAHGYILKSAEEEELFEAIHKVMDGQLYLGRGVAEKVVTGMLSSPDDTKLNDVETAIMRYVANGYENDAIARRMGITQMTVIESLARAMNKLKAKDRHSAALKAIRQGYLTMDDIHSTTDGE
jgi:DNA-binding NarL/FixJ family response regulator